MLAPQELDLPLPRRGAPPTPSTSLTPLTPLATSSENLMIEMKTAFNSLIQPGTYLADDTFLKLNAFYI